jgi:hypothetical protein
VIKQDRCHMEGLVVTLFLIGSLFGLVVLAPVLVMIAESVKLRFAYIYWSSVAAMSLGTIGSIIW